MTRPKVTSIASTDTAVLAPLGSDGPYEAEGGGFPIDFVSGMPGFPGLRRFTILPLAAELQPFSRMQSLDQPEVGFIVFPPSVLFPDYVVEVDEDATARLELKTEDAVVLAIVTLATPDQSPTANLLGPIVVNRASHAALQVVQQGSDYSVAVPLAPSPVADS